MTYELVLTALADPTRRLLFETLTAGPRSVGDLAGDVPVSRPAVSQHLRVLEEAGLVEARKVGRRRIYHARRSGLLALRAWLDHFWTDILDAYQHSFEGEAP